MTRQQKLKLSPFEKKNIFEIFLFLMYRKTCLGKTRKFLKYFSFWLQRIPHIILLFRKQKKRNLLKTFFKCWKNLKSFSDDFSFSKVTFDAVLMSRLELTFFFVKLILNKNIPGRVSPSRNDRFKKREKVKIFEQEKQQQQQTNWKI